MRWNSEAQAREEIKALVAEYYHKFKEPKKDFAPGDRINYASRVFDEKEMCALTDAALDFRHCGQNAHIYGGNTDLRDLIPL